MIRCDQIEISFFIHATRSLISQCSDSSSSRLVSSRLIDMIALRSFRLRLRLQLQLRLFSFICAITLSPSLCNDNASDASYVSVLSVSVSAHSQSAEALFDSILGRGKGGSRSYRSRTRSRDQNPPSQSTSTLDAIPRSEATQYAEPETVLQTTESHATHAVAGTDAGAIRSPGRARGRGPRRRFQWARNLWRSVEAEFDRRQRASQRWTDEHDFQLQLLHMHMHDLRQRQRQSDFDLTSQAHAQIHAGARAVAPVYARTQAEASTRAQEDQAAPAA